MNKKITVNELSKILGVSRNTVSKALNNRPGISEKTRKEILDQAAALGYKKFTRQEMKTQLSIAFLTKTNVQAEGYWLNVMRGAEQVVGEYGHEMKLSFIKSEEEASLVLPQMINHNSIDGFIVAGCLSAPYTRKLMEVPLPKVLIDIDAEVFLDNLKTDIVLMQSEERVCQITRLLIESGHTEIGYIGGTTSQSFKERWLGFARAHREAGIPVNPKYCLTGKTPFYYQRYEDVATSLEVLDRFPTAFVCANDLIALHAIKFLREKGVAVPEEMAITGFDRIKETEFLDFSLTTVDNNEFQLGIRAAEELMLRIQRPQRPFGIIRLFTQVLIGESTTAYRMNPDARIAGQSSYR